MVGIANAIEFTYTHIVVLCDNFIWIIQKHTRNKQTNKKSMNFSLDLGLGGAMGTK